MNFSLGVQQKIKHTVVEASYVGGLSRHLYATRNWNAIPLYAHFDLSNADPTSAGRPLPDSLLAPYPGFAPGPYREYSAPWFGDHKVLRGGCWTTRSRLIHNAYRNFYKPDRRDVWAGFRTCAL